MDTLLLISRIEVLIAAFLAVIAVAFYAIYSPGWHKTFFGRTLFSVMAMFAFTMVVAALTILFGLSTWIIILRFISYTVLVIAFFIIATSVVVIQEREYLRHKKEVEDGKVDSQP